MKIINIATFPPPIGGVSYFLKRLKFYTDKIDSKKYEYVDVSSLDMERKSAEGIKVINKYAILKYLIKEKPAYIIFHSNSFAHLILNLLFMHKHKFVYFTHGESILKEKNRKGWRYRILNHAEYIITPTKELYEEVKKIFPQKVIVKYIPFILFPENVRTLKSKRIIELKEKTEFTFSAYANSLISFKGENLYGIDLIIEMTYILRQNGYKIGIILLITTIDNERLFQYYQRKIKEYAIDEYIIFLDEAIDEASSLYLSTNAYLRPTNTDGDSFSIWEALYMGIPVLTSDATQRPEGCILFKNRNISDLVEKAEFLIEHYKEIKEKTERLDISGSERIIIKFFESL